MKPHSFLLFFFIAFSASHALADNHQPSAYGQYFAVVVSDPSAMVDAMQQYRRSQTGQKLSSNVTLSENIANGANQATHTVSVFYPSAEAMESDLATAAESKDRAEFLRSIGEVANVEAENVFNVLRSRTNDEGVGGDGTATMLFGLTVTDQSRFMQAMNTIFESKAATEFPGNVNFGEIVAMGDTAGTHWVSFQANDLATLLSGLRNFMGSADFAQYAKEANDFRRVEGRFLSRSILTLVPSEN